tara:strand:- start:902 stop:1084 length:183 start_codon:yes stop_codon:yes gene_type:complete
MDMTFRDDESRVRTDQASELIFVPSKFIRMDSLFTGDKTGAVGVGCCMVRGPSFESVVSA